MPRSNLDKFEDGWSIFQHVLTEFGGEDKIKDFDYQQLYYEWLSSKAQGLELKLGPRPTHIHFSSESIVN
jgi:hypothetical protein